MDMSKIFLKDACPTPIGGQAVLDGIMMRGINRTAIAVRLPDNRIYLKTKENNASSKWMKVPIIRGVVSFVNSLVEGTKTLTFSADVLEAAMMDDQEEKKPGKIESWMVKKLGDEGVWKLMLALSVIIALIFSILVFVLLPTAAIDWLKPFVHSPIALNLIEGILRIIMFIGYIFLISKMSDIKKVFQYHGAEHKTIHCFENGLDLTAENAQSFYTLHPRCGTSFLMFVMIISLILFSLLGWPDLLARIISRILLIPVVAGLSYEVLKWAGRTDNKIVRILSLPGLYLQKITTNVPDEEQLKVAIVALKAVLVDDSTPYIEGISDEDGNLLEAMNLDVLREDCREKGEDLATKETK